MSTPHPAGAGGRRREVGGNLLQKYSVKLWFEHLNSLIHYATSVAEGLLLPISADLEMAPKEIKAQLLESVDAFFELHADA